MRAPTRWKRRHAVQGVHQGRASLRVDTPPDKTFLGWVEKGCDLLGDHCSPGRLPVATKTLQHFIARVRQLYEHGPGEPVSARLGAYVRRWVQWVSAGLPTVPQRLLPVLVGADP